MEKELIIRKIKPADSESIAQLTSELGSKVDTKMVNSQILEILKTPDHYAFVAERESTVIGYIHCFRAIRLTSKPFTEICGLIVSEKERSKGIGKLLVQKVESINKDLKIRVRCNSKRELAHKFYANLRYKLKKEQLIFEK